MVSSSFITKLCPHDSLCGGGVFNLQINDLPLGVKCVQKDKSEFGMGHIPNNCNHGESRNYNFTEGN